MVCRVIGYGFFFRSSIVQTRVRRLVSRDEMMSDGLGAENVVEYVPTIDCGVHARNDVRPDSPTRSTTLRKARTWCRTHLCGRPQASFGVSLAYVRDPLVQALTERYCSRAHYGREGRPRPLGPRAHLHPQSRLLLVLVRPGATCLSR